MVAAVTLVTISLNRKLNFGATIRRGVFKNLIDATIDYCCNVPSLLARLLATVIMLDCC